MKSFKAGGTFYPLNHVVRISVQHVDDGYEIYLDYGMLNIMPDVRLPVAIKRVDEYEALVKKIFQWFNYKSSPDVFDVDKVVADVIRNCEQLRGYYV